MTTSHPRLSLSRVGLLPLFLLSPVPRGDGGVPEDKDKENKNLTALLAKNNGDAMALATQLLGENADLRSERRGLRGEVTSLSAKVPGEGAVVLSAAEASAFQVFKAAGEGAVVLSKDDAAKLASYAELGSPDEFKAAKAKGETAETTIADLTGQIAATQRSQLLRDVADEVAPGLKYKASVLQKLDRDTPGLSYELKEFEEAGQNGQKVKVKRAVVKYKEGEGDAAKEVEKPLADYASEVWGDFLPALQVAGAQGGGAQGGAGSQTQFQNGPRHVPQGAAAGGQNNGQNNGAQGQNSNGAAPPRVSGLF